MGLESGSQQKKVDFSNHKHTKIRNGGILYVFLATIHCIHSYSKYVTSCKYLGLPNPANSGTLGTPAKTTMEPDNGHIGRRDFPLGSIISWVSSKLSGSTIGPSAIAWTSFGYCSLGFGLREQLRMETSNKNSWRVGFRGWFHPGVPEYHVQSTVASWWDYPSCERTSSGKAWKPTTLTFRATSCC